MTTGDVTMLVLIGSWSDNSDDSRFDDAGANTLSAVIGAVRWMACVLESF